ncbi:mechanosensitive ion channel family protein [Chitinophaga pinensis]|uniref:MscS Mechanosensitive ion channel n=1 Tax=Chitinophaga pinensis (strain ATCC 43595 / DSM 2588 / LMG 13176 / NBRC 15968 / NCIMB 11800 / UQM 2034) TaxID=485918 RepID=A0A979GTY8_CHIPD|nr:mechanosensitive ion channel family protein [Chitinophaga pinensis]ACU60439.1 MscS Mechanosensitive ion channel [Chitinophaga pinensis DSM 2588]
MVHLKMLLFALLFAVVGHHCFAQESLPPAGVDSTTINEALLVKEEQQKRIDSLVKQQLTKELAVVAGNVKRTEELEAQLRRIAVNDSLRNITQLEKLKALKKSTNGYPVILNQDTLFFIFTRTGSFNARDRASAVSGKIERLYKAPFFEADSLVMVENEGYYDIIYNNNEVIISIGNLDGLWFGKSNIDLAQTYLAIIKQTITKERSSHSLVNLLKRIALVGVIIILLTLIVVLVNKIFRRIAVFISKNKEKYLHDLRLRKIKIITAVHLEKALLRLNTVIKILSIVLIVYLSFPLLFSVFPETEAWTDTLLKWILSPLKSATRAIIDYLPNLFKVIVIYFIFRYLLKGIRYFFDEVKGGNIQLGGFHPDWAIPTFNILRFVLYAFMLVLVFPFLPGSGSPAFQGVSVFLGILISLGSSSAITNIVAGLVITYMRPFRIGDRVKIGEVVGDIVEKSMLVIRIKTIKNEDVTVPNSMVLSSSTINYSSHTKSEGLIVHYTVTIGYDVPWQQAYELLIAAALKTVHVEEAPKPFVLQTSLDDFYISYQINAYTKEANKQAVIYSNLLENIQDVFNNAGIEIMSPNYHVVRDGGKV